MGFFKKVFRPVRKIAKKIIPKEVRPFLPYIAAGFGPAGLAGTQFAAMNPAFQKAILAGVTSAATDEQGNPFRAAALAAAPDVLSQGLGNVASRIDPNLIADSDSFVQIGDSAAKAAGTLSRAGKAIEGASTFKTIGAQTAVDQAAKFAEIRQDEIDAYNANLLEQGVQDKTKRRAAIFGIYKNAGYDDDYVNNMLDRYGYDMGGIVEFFKSLNLKVPKGMKAMSNRKKLYDDKDENIVIPPEKPKEDDEDSEPVPVREVDKYDLAGGLMAAADGVQKAFGRGFGEMEPVPMLRFARGGEVEEEGIMSKIVDSMGDDYDYFTRIKIRENLKQGETNEDAINLAEQEAMGMVKEKYGFARGGEVEIEEETDDLGIMDLMRDQGIEYGEQASNAQNDEILERLFEEFLDMGFSPEDAAKKAREAFDDMSQKPSEGIMQMASGYKDDIDEMYEQYVFEMEEQGLQPMSFSQFLARERAGMEDGGKVKRRKKGEPADEIIETEEEIFLNTMPRPKRQGIMEAADGGIMEKDMRGGGFIPEGTKERADDVPARLSKNEFVMTADAVRAAGGGSVNKGAKRMYDMMYSLEGKV
jgi:hypothetical protein